MLTGIAVLNAVGKELLTLPVSIPDPGVPYLTKDIEGLGPVRAEITSSAYAGLDGSLYQNARSGNRNIVMKIGYRPDRLLDQTVQNLRRELYAYFPPKGVVTLKLLSDDFETVQIKGYVESHEPVIFSKDPEVQISIMCLDPYFDTLTSVSVNGYNDKAINVSYYGTAGTGFVFDFYLNRSLTSVTLDNGLGDLLVYNEALQAGDVLSISTVRGNKYVRRSRSGATINALDGLISGTLAMEVDSRTTGFSVKTGGASDIPFKLTFTPKHSGV